MQNAIKQVEKTFISSSTSIVGNLKTAENLIINSTLKGNVEIGDYDFFLGPNGRLEGEVHAKNVRIRGHMKGEIKAKEKVEITKEAHFSGKIISKSISVEKGAYFDAYVDLHRESPGGGTLKETSFDKPIAELVQEPIVPAIQIGKVTRWQSHNAYNKAFKRLLRDWKAEGQMVLWP